MRGCNGAICPRCRFAHPGYASSLALLVMTAVRHAFTFSRRDSRVRALLLDLPSRNRGHGECRALAAPMARLQQKKQAAVTTGSAENTRHSPRNGWNGCFAFSPVLRAFWPPCRDNALKRVARVIPASGYQDHAT